jgi:hypothetical protein
MSTPGADAAATTPRERLADGLFIAAVVAASAALYVGSLGFYSDDWAMLWAIGRDGGAASFAQTIARSFWTDSINTRPVHAVYGGILVWLFGTQPLGYHVVNTVVIAAGAVLLYRVFLALGAGRAVALAVALVHALLPHYATVRFWFVCFQVPLSLVGYAACLLADLRAGGAPLREAWPWRLASVAALLLSVMSYEIFMPLIVLNPVLVALAARRSAGGGPLRWRPLVPFTLVQWTLLVAAGLFKAAYTARLPPASVTEHAGWFAKLLADAAGTAVVGDFGLGLPRVLADIALRHDVVPVLAAGVATGVAIAAWLAAALRRAPASLPGRAAAGLLLAGAVVAFLGGYGIFLLTFNAGVSTTGMNNRTALAAAIGYALALVAASAWLASLLRSPPARRALFAGLVGAACASGFVVINTLGLLWGEAAARQAAVRAALLGAVPALPAGASVIVDGACPYVGPAPVFETWWDTTGFLRLLYRDDSLRGDVVTERLAVGEDGVYTSMYGKRVGPYPYGNLWVFDAQAGVLRRIDGPYAARAYFASRAAAPDDACRPSREGAGEAVFVPGGPRARFPVPSP